MAEPTITGVFGSNAAQTATTLTIDKADLAAVGLTAAPSNTAESLLTAILLLAKGRLSQSAFDSNLDQSLTLTDGFQSIVQRDNGGTLENYRQIQVNVNFHTVDSSNLDPDNY
ncbi:MAG: hypothetical protein AAFS06_05190 [Cyanobacteria bacterium J06631_12]